jgi:GT2 family glycosyltransferase
MANYQPKKLDVVTLENRLILEEITVVIPTLGRPILEECLYWITLGTAWPGGLIVVDQGSNSLITSWIEELQLLGINAVYVPSDKRGRAAGVNRGLERANTIFVAITDDDCFVDNYWLEKMTLHLRENPGAIVTGRVEPGNEDVVLEVTSLTPNIQRRPRLTFDSMSGGNMGTSQAVIEKVGQFDEDPRLRTAEDGEWAYRALRAGVPIVYAPDVCVEHHDQRDADHHIEQYRDYAHSHGGFYGKYLRQGDWFIALRAAVHHFRVLLRLFRGLATANRELAQNGFAYLIGLGPGIIAGLRAGDSID